MGQHKLLVDGFVFVFSSDGITIDPSDLIYGPKFQNALQSAAVLFQKYCEWFADKYMTDHDKCPSIEIRKAYHKVMIEKETPELAPLLQVAIELERHYLQRLGVAS